MSGGASFCSIGWQLCYDRYINHPLALGNEFTSGCESLFDRAEGRAAFSFESRRRWKTLRWWDSSEKDKEENCRWLPTSTKLNKEFRISETVESFGSECLYQIYHVLKNISKSDESVPRIVIFFSKANIFTVQRYDWNEDEDEGRHWTEGHSRFSKPYFCQTSVESRINAYKGSKYANCRILEVDGGNGSLALSRRRTKSLLSCGTVSFSHVSTTSRN